MIAIAAIAMTVAYPGVYFPEISSRYARKLDLKTQVQEDMEYAGGA